MARNTARQQRSHRELTAYSDGVITMRLEVPEKDYDLLTLKDAFELYRQKILTGVSEKIDNYSFQSKLLGGEGVLFADDTAIIMCEDSMRVFYIRNVSAYNDCSTT